MSFSEYQVDFVTASHRSIERSISSFWDAIEEPMLSNFLNSQVEAVLGIIKSVLKQRNNIVVTLVVNWSSWNLLHFAVTVRLILKGEKSEVC